LSKIAFPLLLWEIDYFVKSYLNNPLLSSAHNTITNVVCLQRASSPRFIEEYLRLDRVDFLISPETKDLSPCILAIVSDAHRVRRSRGIFSSSPSRFPQSRLVAAGSGTRTNAAQPKDW